MEEFNLIKQIAKHGNQGVILIPKILSKELTPKTLVELRIKILKKASEVQNEKRIS